MQINKSRTILECKAKIERPNTRYGSCIRVEPYWNVKEEVTKKICSDFGIEYTKLSTHSKYKYTLFILILWKKLIYCLLILILISNNPIWFYYYSLKEIGDFVRATFTFQYDSTLIYIHF